MILEVEGPFIIPSQKGSIWSILELIVGSWHVLGHLFLGDCLIEQYLHKHRDAQRRRQYEQCYFATILSYYILCVCLAVLKLDLLKPSGVYSNSIFHIYTCIFTRVTSHVQCLFPIYRIGSHTKQHTHKVGPKPSYVYIYIYMEL